VADRFVILADVCLRKFFIFKGLWIQWSIRAEAGGVQTAGTPFAIYIHSWPAESPHGCGAL